MIVQETQGNLIHTYSDAGFYIHGGEPEADYIDALDPVDAGRTYVETDIPVPVEDDEATVDGEATVEDYEEALHELGVV